MITHENTKCPELPEWLRLAEAYALKLKHDLIPAHLVGILSHYRRALNHNFVSAEILAELYESGDLPCGACITKAAEWHEYAAKLGSVKSALRLARMKLWLSNPKSIANVKEMAAMAIGNTYKVKSPSQNDLCITAQAAMILLDNTPNDSDLQIVKELLENNIFLGHPDHKYISEKMSLNKSLQINNNLSLQVALRKIIEDADFKCGVYKALEAPLPLTNLPDADRVKLILDFEFPWFSCANDEIFRQLIVQQHSYMPAFKLRPILIVGPPGVGKTTWVKRLAELCGVPLRLIMAAGGSDSMYLKGTSRGWSSSRPGAVPQTMATELVANPLFFVDELDKASSNSKNGRIWDVLLQLIEPATSKLYLDECLQVPCDLSWVSWIATVNEIGSLPKPLLERFSIVVVQTPGEEHFQSLVKSVIENFARELGIDIRMLPTLDAFDKEVLMRCNGPREISRLARTMIEVKIVEARQKGITS